MHLTSSLVFAIATEFVSGSLSGLTSLSQLLLNTNRITVLEWGMFNVQDFIQFGGHPGT